MNIYVLLSKIFPESNLKDKLRIILYTYFKNEALVGYKRRYKIREGDVVIDAGAFPGDFSIYASRKVGETGKVICFEPDPANFIALSRVTRKRSNIIVINKGLWKGEGRLDIVGENQSATISHGDIKTGVDTIEVISLDEQLNKMNIPKADFIKMDIEGAEIEALDGMVNTLKNSGTNLAIASYHIVNGEKTCFTVENKLKLLGYEVVTEYKRHLTTYGVKK